MADLSRTFGFTFFFVVFFLAVLGWLLPNQYPPWGAFYQSFAWCAVVLMLALLLYKCKVLCPLFFLFLFFLTSVPLLQYLCGVVYFLGDAVLASTYIASFLIALVVGYSLTRTLSRSLFVSSLASVILLGSVLSVWLALRQWTGLPGDIWVLDLPLGRRPFANLGQPNNLATLVSMGLAAVIYFYEKQRFNWLCCSVLAVFLLFGLALTQSRTPWLASIAFCFFWKWKSFTCNTRLRFSVLLFWILVFSILVLTLPLVSELLVLNSSDPLQRMKSLERLDLYRQLYLAIIYGPLWGYGWNQVSVAQVAITPIYSVSLMTEYAHNILLDFLIWNGPLLGGVIIIAIAIWLSRLAWIARSSESLFSLLAAGFLLTHSMVEYPHAYAYFLLPLGLLLGVAEAESQSTKFFIIPHWVLSAVLLVFLSLGVHVFCEYRTMEEDFRLMRFETANIGAVKAEQAAPDVKLLTQISEYARYARTEAAENMNEGQLEWMRKVAHRYPYYSSLSRYSYALALNNRAEEAYAQIRVLRGLHGEKKYAEFYAFLMVQQEAYPQLAQLVNYLNGSSI